MQINHKKNIIKTTTSVRMFVKVTRKEMGKSIWISIFIIL